MDSIGADLWAGSFGDEYTLRNAEVPNRQEFWSWIAGQYLAGKPKKVVEVGCNTGTNLTCLRKVLALSGFFGIDVNKLALSSLHSDIVGLEADLLNLPWYLDHVFDLAISFGVLIHVPERQLDDAIRALFRLSRKYVLVGEYHADEWTDIPYHGEEKALRKGPFDRRIKVVTRKEPVDTGFLDKKAGFDRVTWWMYEV